VKAVFEKNVEVMFKNIDEDVLKMKNKNSISHGLMFLEHIFNKKRLKIER
jgi:hypothetical protein